MDQPRSTRTPVDLEEVGGVHDGVDFDDPEVRDRLRRFWSTDEANRYFWVPGAREAAVWSAAVRARG